MRSGLEDGFDAMVEFPPHSMAVPEVTDRIPGLCRKFTGKIYSYPDIVRLQPAAFDSCMRLPVYRGIMTGWDNTARRGTTVTSFRARRRNTTRCGCGGWSTTRAGTMQGDRRLIFVNSWNEWAEGAYLEPDEKHGYRFLDATARAVFGVPDAAALVRTLRQINDGNDEAQGVLDELEHAVKINEQIVELVESKGLAAGARFALRYSRPVPSGRPDQYQASGKVISDGAIGHLDAVEYPELRERRHPRSRIRRLSSGMDCQQAREGRSEVPDRLSAHEPRVGRAVPRAGDVTRAPRGRRGPAQRAGGRS